jgi:MFS family permease
VLFERRQHHPLLDPRLFSNRKLSAGSLSICIQFFAFFGFTFVSLQYLEGVRGYSPLVAALAVLPLSATMMPAARLTSGLASRFGARAVCVTGLVLVAAGLVIISRVGTDTSYLLMLAGLVPLGIGMGAAMTPATAAITEALPQAQQGVGSALNDLSREVGGALGTAVIGSIVTAVYRSSLQLPGAPAPLVDQARASFAVAIHAGGSTGAHARDAFVNGIHTGLLYAAGAAILAAISVAALLKSEAQDPPTRQPTRPAAAGIRRRAGSLRRPLSAMWRLPTCLSRYEHLQEVDTMSSQRDMSASIPEPRSSEFDPLAPLDDLLSDVGLSRAEAGRPCPSPGKTRSCLRRTVSVRASASRSWPVPCGSRFSPPAGWARARPRAGPAPGRAHHQPGRLLASDAER